MTGAPETGRLRSLDGLRGVAALVVVFHHLFLVSPSLAEAIWPIRDTAVATVAWRAITSPLHLVVSAGFEAVIVFFILSGLVLTIPATGWRGIRPWLVYYPRRLVRLCLPVIASIALAGILLLVVHRYPISGQEQDWLSSTNSMRLTFADVGASLNVFGQLQPLNNPLWSLGWEILFSLLLPVAVLIAFAVRGRVIASGIVIAGCLVIATVGTILGVGFAAYLPMFIIGAVLAAILPAGHQRIVVAGAAMPQRESRIGGIALFVGCLVLVSLPWIASAISGTLYAPTVGFAVLGCLGLVVLSTRLSWLRASLTRPIIQWLGRVSFSLYLVHVPVIVTIAYLVGPSRWQIYIPLGVIASLLVAWGFYVVAERPSHLLSRWIGNRIGQAAPRV